MQARVFLSVNIVAISLILWIFPERENNKNQPSPTEEVQNLEKGSGTIDVDRTARIINESNASYQIIDVRTAEEFRDFNLPGSINIPLENLLKPEYQGYLKPIEKTNILYSNDDDYSSMAVAMLESKGYTGNVILKGGLNEWFDIVMNTEFTGGRISARENALYENRTKAKKLFIEINSLPDSLKNNFLEAKLLNELELIGGCE